MNDGETKPQKKAFFESTCCEGVSWSSDGSICVYRETTGVRVFDMKTNSQRFALDLPKVVAVSISPLNSWLVTLVPFKSEPNLQIWDMATGKLHFSFVQMSFSRQSWPYLQWDSKENHAIFHHGDSIIVYNGHDFLDTSSQQTLKSGNLDYPFPFSVSSRSVVSLSPSSVCPAVAVFSVLREGEGVLFYFACRPCDPDRFRLVAHSRILGCSHASFEWNALGDRALVTVGSDVDQTGASYYGRTFLYYLFNDLESRAQPIQCVLRTEQSVQDAHFAHDGSKFCTITASVPALTSLYESKECKQDYDCQKLNVNTALWSPHGRLLLLGVGAGEAWDVGLREPERRHRDLGLRGAATGRAVQDGVHHLVRLDAQRALSADGHVLPAHEDRQPSLPLQAQRREALRGALRPALRDLHPTRVADALPHAAPHQGRPRGDQRGREEDARQVRPAPSARQDGDARSENEGAEEDGTQDA